MNCLEEDVATIKNGGSKAAITVDATDMMMDLKMKRASLFKVLE